MPWKLGSALFSGALEKTNFLWQKEWCRAVDTKDYFSCSLWGGVRRKKARKKERKIKSTRVELAQRPRFKTRDETVPLSIAGGLRGPFPASLPRRSEARVPPERIRPQFHKGPCIGQGEGRRYLGLGRGNKGEIGNGYFCTSAQCDISIFSSHAHRGQSGPGPWLRKL